MKKVILGAIVLGLLSTTVYAKYDIGISVYGDGDSKFETMPVCELPSKMTQGSIGDTATMCGGKCNGKTLSQMNKSGWKLTTVIGGLKGGFGMLFTK